MSDDGKIGILLVDDRPQDLLVLRSLLAAPTRDLVTATSGPEALRYLLERDFALIVLDVFMPGMTGFELATLIRKRERSAHTPILFLTGGGPDVGFIYEAYSVGAVDYLTKPVDPGILRAKVDVFVELFVKDRRIREQGAALLEAQQLNQQTELARVRIENARRYRHLADAISHIVWTADAEGTPTYYNLRWQEYTGAAPDETKRSWFEVVHPTERNASEQQWTQALALGEPLEAECRLRREDGVYRWHLCRAFPERDDQGRVYGWLGTLTDVDDVLRARIATEGSRRRLSFLVEASAALSGSLDIARGLAEFSRLAVPTFADGCILDVWDGSMGTASVLSHEVFHCQPEKRHLLERVAPLFTLSMSEREGLSAVLHREMSDGWNARLESIGFDRALVESLGLVSAMVVPVTARTHLFGTITLVSSRPNHVYDEDDLAMAAEVGRRAGVAVENSLLYRASERAIQARDEFLSVASHELRTPLSALLLQLGGLESNLRAAGIMAGEKSLKPIKKIAAALRNTTRLSKLIDNLLDVTRLTTTRPHLDIEACDLSTIVADVAERFSEEAKEAGCELIVHASPGGAGNWDRLRIDQVVTNLLSNAIKYGRGSAVELNVTTSPQAAFLSVRDHGIGIAQENQARIFDRFERAAPLHHYGGLGLGLYIVRKIVEAHAGAIGVASTLGEGTTFTVELPLHRLTRPRDSAPNVEQIGTS